MKKREDETFAEIYTRFRKNVLRYVSLRVFDAQVAEEVTQEVFVKVYRFRDSYDGKYPLAAWIRAIARNTICDVLRKNGDQEQRYCEDSAVDFDEFPSKLQDAESILERKDIRRVVIKMLKPLTRLQRRVLWMRVVQQRSYSEISKQLGLSLSAVKNLAYRARLTLTDRFGNVPDLTLA